jgi:DNA invertase Pin-like site-specific DNA recombinase
MLQPTEMPRAFSYVRFSTPEQAKGDSFRRQSEGADRYARAKCLVLDTDLTFQDLGVSGYRGKNAETGRLAEFLELVRAQRVPRGSVLIVESLDRISRQAARRALRTLEDIVEEGVTVVTLADGKEYTAESLDRDPTSLIMAVLIFIRANEESVMKGSRLRAAWQAKRKAARERPLTERAPAWLRLDRHQGRFVAIPERAVVVRRIFRLAEKGAGQHRIAEELNRAKVPTFGKAAMWHRSYVKRVLENPAVVGTLVPRQVEWDGRRKIRKVLDSVEGYFP